MVGQVLCCSFLRGGGLLFQIQERPLILLRQSRSSSMLFENEKALLLLGYQFFLLSADLSFLLKPVPLPQKDLSLEQDLLNKDLI